MRPNIIKRNGLIAPRIASALLFLLFFLAQSELPFPTDVAPELTANAPTMATELGRTGTIEVLYRIPDGYHQSYSEDFFGVEAAPVQGLRFGATEYPDSDEVLYEIPVYRGDIRLSLPFIVDSIPAGGVEIPTGGVEIPTGGVEIPAGGVGIPAEEQADTAGRRIEVTVTAKWQLCEDDGACLMPSSRGLVVTVPVTASGTPSSANSSSLGNTALMLLFALLGGLLLNIMPCVLPVLSLKALSLVEAGRGGTEALARQRRHGLAGAGGIVASMILLALLVIAVKAGGAVAGWGFQFQSPFYSAALCAVVLVFALSLFDVFMVGQPTLRSGKKTTRIAPSLRAFGTGFLTVFLATPCTAPFLGTAMGFAFSADWPLILAVFSVTGLGLALPWLLIAFLPGIAKRLPKPGAWMDLLRGACGFALLGTAVWLLVVLDRQIPDAAFAQVLAGLLVLGLAAWLWGIGQRSVRKPGRVAARVLAIAAAAFALTWGAFSLATEADEAVAPNEAAETSALPDPWQVFGEERVETARREGRPVFIDFTAAWCLTCQVNESGPLSDPEVLAAFRRTNTLLLRGDYTNPDPVIAEWLERFGRAGVPFYLWIPAEGEPILLPELLTRNVLLRTIDPAR